MIKLGKPETVTIFNQRSLSTLVRAIKLSYCQFSLILVRCNYVALQKKVAEELEVANQLPLPIGKIYLPESITTLFTPIYLEFKSQSLSCLMVFGLESVKAIEQLLVATNQVRDEFRKNLTLPLVIWVTDDILQKLTRFAPDFKSWASASIKFALPPNELLALWQQIAQDFLEQLLSAKAEFISNQELALAPGCQRRQALEFAREDLSIDEINLEPSLEAVWLLILGRDAYV
ncbi:MAG: hypothetical protein F6K24_42180, partial [Okeania sp. SIO2D1]|nr:hypothetical protein [Okeania sp. SIO2D1]